ncbi:hypothetical protein SFC55_19635 [Niallia taxi]|uniref:hypothetical protein n=1 Tax=Niallia taxi TaxID=2499688 RepID=UPI003981AF76
MKVFPIMLTASCLLLTGCSTKEQANSTENTKVSASSNQVQAEQTANNTDAATELTNREVLTDIRNELKIKDALLPESFPVEDGNYLGAHIEENTQVGYSIRFYESVAEDSNQAGEPLAEFTATTDEDAPAFPAFDEENIPEDMSVDLGYGINGILEGAAGSTYLQWKEGRWILQIKAVSADNRDLQVDGKKMVKYLEEHALPAPHDEGMVEVSYPKGENNAEIRIIWEDDSTLYTLATTGDPVDALKMAVSVK